MSLNDSQSFDHKAVFVRQYYGQQQVPVLHIKNCPTSIELAAVFVRKNDLDEIEFGYEVFVHLTIIYW